MARKLEGHMRNLLFYKRNVVTKLFVRHATAGPTFKFSDLQVTLTSAPQEKPDPDKLVFGHHFSDHLLEIDWMSSKGWDKPVISPFHNLSLHPASKVLHYASELFEGMKAYRGVDNKIRLFRPLENMKRMNNTAKRAALPTFDGAELVKCIKKLISIDQEFVPYSTTSTLYVRPTLIGTTPTLGVTRTDHAKLYVLVGPVGPYFPTGMKPVTLLADPQFVRAWPGSCGAFKMGSNYAPTIAIQDIASKDFSCQQVLWLYGEDHELTEVGTMNLFMYWLNEQGEEELITAPLDGLILPGVTRSSLLALANKWGEFKVTEGRYNMKQVTRALKENRVFEIFGAGTACVVCPVGNILYKNEMLDIPTMKEAKLTKRFFKELTDIQFGRTPSEWVEMIDG
ncbi:branched-chain-amino-acid aminotransferase-like [Gigantopelta aegis]|uniref:branched-chain-amino-acid aminotransferase-like n=1 Tax=Gigantopelta aegis TaxID=1735272 RepID=UPI001B88AB5D|nr:branched-chain-amino-acid aminotransferase-like [Gigantopelta aegis]